MATTPLVIAVVLNYNLPAETIDCVASLLDSDYVRLRVVVVDNGSTDDSVDQLRQRFGERIDLLPTGQNLYYAGGNNVGLRQALQMGADWILVLNNDTLVAPDLVSRLVASGIDRPGVGIVGPMIYWGAGSERIWVLGSRRRGWWGFPRDIGRGELDHGQYAQPFAVDYAVGCGLMVSRELLLRVGLFDPAYRMYYEDADLSARARRAGFRLLVEPRARMWHLVSLSTSRQPAMSCYQKTRYRVRFYRQHAAVPLAWLTHVLLAGQELGHASVDWLCGRRELAGARWRGLRDGWTQEVI